MPSYSSGTGKGLKEPCPPHRQTNVFGAEFGTPDADGWNCAPTLVGSTSSFDLSTISKNHEVVVALLVAKSTKGGEHTIGFRWYRNRDNKFLFDFEFNYSASLGGWFYGYSFIGWNDWEISENGNYRVEIDVSGAGSYQRTIAFAISGIPVEPPPPPPEPPPATGIVEAFNSVSAFFYSLYLTTLGWVWPFWYIAEFFYGLSSLFSSLARLFSGFLTLINAIVAKVKEILNWDTIWSYIISYIPNLLQIRDWFYYWWDYVTSVITVWWSATLTDVKGWISTAVQLFNDMLTAWNNFWNNTWPQLTSAFNTLKSAWDNFWTVTFPNLVSFDWLETWWYSQLADVNKLVNDKLKVWLPFYDDFIKLWGSIALFFTDPVEYIWQRFTDWFLGPEV